MKSTGSGFGFGGCSIAAGLIAFLATGCGSGGVGSMTGSSLMGGTQSSGGTQQVALQRLSTDLYTNPQSQHATEVEPAMAANVSTLVTAFQVGRMFTAGSTNIGFATSTDAGATWTNGFLSGITQFAGGGFNAASDPSIAFDQAHTTWIIASLGVGSNTDTVVVSRSTDAETWSAPITVSFTPDADKPWITCDNNRLSPFFGYCYIEWDDPSQPGNGVIWMSTSVDGGNSWSAAINTADRLAGVGGQPVVSTNGVVVVPLQSSDGTRMLAFTSGNGGDSWGPAVTISNITDHLVAGGLRTSPLPSAAVDAAGHVYVVWQDCRFRTNCASNDIVLTTSLDGVLWTAPVAVPIDAITLTTVDHFLPALAANPITSGAAAQLGLTYYFYPNAACTASTCQLDVGFIASSDGGSTWDTATMLAGPMSLAWLPNTQSGLMVGDYVATTYSNSQPRAVFAVAQTKTSSVFDEAIFTTVNPLPQTHRAVRRVTPAEAAVNFHSDHPPRQFYDLEREHPIPPGK